MRILLQFHCYCNKVSDIVSEREGHTYLSSPSTIARSVKYKISDHCYLQLDKVYTLHANLESEGIGSLADIVFRELAPYANSVLMFSMQTGRNFANVF